MRVAKWRQLGRPEAALIGVQYAGSDSGEHRGPWIVRQAGSRLFAGMGVEWGSAFGSGGIEIDAHHAGVTRRHQGAGRDP